MLNQMVNLNEHGIFASLDGHPSCTCSMRVINIGFAVDERIFPVYLLAGPCILFQGTVRIDRVRLRVFDYTWHAGNIGQTNVRDVLSRYEVNGMLNLWF